jgi:hypothetical protein
MATGCRNGEAGHKQKEVSSILWLFLRNRRGGAWNIEFAKL